MSHIKNIEIKNFKSIRDAKIEDCRRVNVFIGYPNVGKSNILEAMSLTSPEFNNSGRPISLKDLCRFEELIGLYSDGNKNKEIKIVIDDFNYILEYFDPNTIQYGVFERGVDSFDITNATKRLIVNRNGNFNQVSLNKNKKKPAKQIRKYHFRNVYENIKTNPILLDYPFGDNLFEVIRYNQDLRKQCGELFVDYNLMLAFDENVRLKIQKRLDEYSVFQIETIQVSDTLLRVIFYKAAIVSNKESVLLFEEPEAHMFPPYISKFTSDIMYDENNNQYFITTHSPFVLNDFMENLKKEDYSIYAVGYKKDSGETTIRRFTDDEIHEMYQYGIDLFFNLENYLPHEQ